MKSSRQLSVVSFQLESLVRFGCASDSLNRYWLFASGCRLRASSRELRARIAVLPFGLLRVLCGFSLRALRLKAFVKNQILNRKVR